MNVSELARRLRANPRELLEALPQFGFDIGGRAVKVDNRVAQQIVNQWPSIQRELRRRTAMARDAQKEKEVGARRESGAATAIPAVLTVREFAERLGLPVTRVIAELMKSGVLASQNERIDRDTATIIANDLGFQVQAEVEVAGGGGDVASESRLAEVLGGDGAAAGEPRAPVVVVMGHVDHGKCVTGDTKILFADGRLRDAAQLWEEAVQHTHAEPSPDGVGEFVKPEKGERVVSFDSETCRLVTAPLEAFWRLPAPAQLVEVELKSGDRVRTTPEHPFFVLQPSGNIEQVSAAQLTEGEFVVVPQTLPLRDRREKVAQILIGRLGGMQNFLVLVHGERGASFLDKLADTNKEQLFRDGSLTARAHSREYGLRRLRARDYVFLGRLWGYSDGELWTMIEAVKYASEKQRASHRSPFIRFPQPGDDMRQLGYLLGCLAGDGYINHGVLNNNDHDIQETYAEAVREIFGLTTTTYQSRSCDVLWTSGGETFVHFLFDLAGFPKKDKSASVVLPEIAQLDRDIFHGFIAGWFDTDGYVSPFNWSVEITSKSRTLVEQCATLLLRDGVHGVIAMKKGYATLRVANEPYLSRFAETYPFACERKRARLTRACEHASTSRIFDLTPFAGSSLTDMRVPGGSETIPYLEKYKEYRHLSRPFLHTFAKEAVAEETLILQKIKRVTTEAVSFVPVRTVKKVRAADPFVYDFTVAGTHTFIGNRIVLHNTKLLDSIRKTNVMEGESGGITQHIGAYQTMWRSKDGSTRAITFIDTPGHEAFTVMRSRGAKVADIAILVVAADDGVQPQTVEAINIIKAAKLPFVVAINKIDKEDANPDKVKTELSQHGVQPEEWGGAVPMVPISAREKQNIDKLLDVLLLVADLNAETIRAPHDRPAIGTIIESRVDKGAGPVATVLVQAGTLHLGDPLVVNNEIYGKVRAMKDYRGSDVAEAAPSMPVRILGFKVAPGVGDILDVEQAASASQIDLKQKRTAQKGAERASVVATTATEMEDGKKYVAVFVKADVLGSLEAILGELEKMRYAEIGVRVIGKGLGNITDDDVRRAKAAEAFLLGFKVNPTPVADELIREEGMVFNRYDVIYDLLKFVRAELERALGAEKVETAVARGAVLKIFRTEKKSQTLGIRVESGTIVPGLHIRVMRKGEMVGEAKLASLQMGRSAAKSVPSGSECGIGIEGRVEAADGDSFEFYIVTEKKKTLTSS